MRNNQIFCYALLSFFLLGCAGLKHRAPLPECHGFAKYSSSEIEERKSLAAAHRAAFKEYRAATSTMIQKNWAWVGAIPSESADVYLSIDKEGVIQCAKIVKSSGSPDFDQSVLDAVTKVKRVAPPPPEIAVLFNEVRLAFFGSQGS
jgi:TonB family protein